MLDMHPTYTELVEVMPERLLQDILLIKRVEERYRAEQMDSDA